LFAAFPHVYATVFGGFYLVFMLLLAALIFRAVAIGFRSKQPMRWWRGVWEGGFFGGSVLSSFLIGVAMGNIAWGIPIDERGEFAGTFRGLLHSCALLLGITTIAPIGVPIVLAYTVSIYWIFRGKVGLDAMSY